MRKPAAGPVDGTTRRRMLGVLAAALTAGLSGARAQEGVDLTALAEDALAYEAAVLAGDHAAVVDAMPPRVVAAFAADLTLDEATVRARTIAGLRGAVEGLTVTGFALDLDRIDLVEAGEQRFALIPSRMTVDAGTRGRFVQVATLLGVEEDGAWFFYRVGMPAQDEAIRRVYPALADVAFTPAAVEAAE